MIHNHISPIAFFNVHHGPWSTIHTKSQRSHKTLNLISKALKQECNALRLSHAYVFCMLCVVKMGLGRDNAHPANVGDQKLVVNLLIPFKKVTTKTYYFHNASKTVLLKLLIQKDS